MLSLLPFIFLGIIKLYKQATRKGYKRQLILYNT